MSKVFASLLGVSLCTLSAPGTTQRSVQWSFAEATTAQGCIAYIQFDAFHDTAAVARNMHRLSWTGSGCRKGQPINGVGTLRDALVGKSTYLTKGRMIDGVFDGPTTNQRVGSGQKPYTKMMSMGCGVFDNGQPYTDCTPRPRPPTSPTRK